MYVSMVKLYQCKVLPWYFKGHAYILVQQSVMVKGMLSCSNHMTLNNQNPLESPSVVVQNM